MKSAIVTVVFNTDKFIRKQYELYTKYVDANFIIIDNSTDTLVSVLLKDFADANNVRLIKTTFEERDFSRSHGMACNRAYYLLHKEYDLLLFSDHDLFPVCPIDLSFMQDKVIAGVPQVKWEETYLWAGLVIINNNLIDRNAVDFMPAIREQFDTGGELNKIFKHLPADKYHLFAERPQKEITKIFFNIEETENPTFIHLRNGSNWANEDNYEERINRGMEAL